MTEKNSIIFIVLWTMSTAYMVYAIWFSNRDPLKKFYQRLLTPTVYAIHFSGAGLLAILGIFLARKLHELYAVLLGPMIFLALLFACNQVTRILYKRNVIFLFRGEKKPKDYVWYVDGVLGVLCLIVSFVLPAYITVYFRPYHEVKIGITNG